MPDYELVPIPDHEAAVCPYPRPVPTPPSHRAHHAVEGANPFTTRRGRCFFSHPADCVWNGAEWFCTHCDRAVRDGVFVLRPLAPAIVLHRLEVDDYYASATALFRHAAVSNSSWASRHAKRDRWREDVPAEGHPYERGRRWRP